MRYLVTVRKTEVLSGARPEAGHERLVAWWRPVRVCSSYRSALVLLHRLRRKGLIVRKEKMVR